MALIVLIGDDVLEAYELRLLDNLELFDGEELRRKEVRMVENERDWKREVLILAGRDVYREEVLLGGSRSFRDWFRVDQTGCS